MSPAGVSRPGNSGLKVADICACAHVIHLMHFWSRPIIAEERDRRVFVAGIELARTLLKLKPLQLYYDYECYPVDEAQTDDELLDAGTHRG